MLEKLQTGARGYLITKAADEIVLQQRCQELGIWLIPKNFVREILTTFN